MKHFKTKNNNTVDNPIYVSENEQIEVASGNE